MRLISNSWYAIFIVLMMLVACCGNGEDDSSSPPTSTNIPFENPPVSGEIALPTPTPLPFIVVTRTPEPTLGPQPTPTFPYPILDYVGEWGFYMQVKIADNPFADEIRYSGNFFVTVGLDGSVNGRGYLTPTLQDDDCQQIIFLSVADTITNSEDEFVPPLGFNVSGTLLYDGNTVWMDFEFFPDNYLFLERYNKICQNYLNSGETSVNLLWVSLGESQRLAYRIPLEQPYGQVFHEINEDLTAKTNNRLQGALNVQFVLNHR